MVKPEDLAPLMAEFGKAYTRKIYAEVGRAGTTPARARLLMSLQCQGSCKMADTSKIKEHMDVISSDRKTVGKVDHLDGSDKIKLTKQSSPDGQHHHFIPVDWVDHVDQHVHLNKSGADVTSHWQHGQQ